MIDLVIDTMLPGDATLGMPPASTVDFAGYLRRHGIAAQVDGFLDVLARVAAEQFGQPFGTLDEAARLAAINRCKVADIRLFSAFVTHVLRAYYTDERILRGLSGGAVPPAVPPFPAGNPLDADDWAMLEPVYERGRIDRRAEPPPNPAGDMNEQEFRCC